MCFSAGSSFTASALLALAGIVALSRTKRHQEYMFALIPMFFALQQSAEGILWLSFIDPRFEILQKPATYSFLAFAFCVWPIWIPASLTQLYRNSIHASYLRACTILGSLIAITLLMFLIIQGATASIEGSHILYAVALPTMVSIGGSILYLCATVLPFFLINRLKSRIFGGVLLLLYLISIWFYTQVSASVWCFFAALLSILVFLII